MTVREFSTVFDFSTSTLNIIEKDKDKAIEATKRLKILLDFPDVSIYALMTKGGVLPEDKKNAAIKYLQQCS